MKKLLRWWRFQNIDWSFRVPLLPAYVNLVLKQDYLPSIVKDIYETRSLIFGGW